MRLLVTGGTGFIGSHLAEEGRRRGAEVVVLGLTDRRWERRNAQRLAAQGAEVISGDITDRDVCVRAARGATHIFHLAVAMREGAKDDQFFESINLDGTRHLLEVASREAVARFVYCSTIGIFGHRAPGITREDAPFAPGNIYERTKVSAERLVRGFAQDHGVPAVILRPADVYGPRDERLFKLFKGVSRGRFPLFGRGDGRRHMVYVDDVVSAFFMAADRAEAVGEALIIAGPRACTTRQLIEMVAAADGRRRYGVRLPLAPMLALAAAVEDLCRVLKVDPPIYRRRLDFFSSDAEFETSRAQRLLGWRPRVDVQDGVRRTMAAYLEAGDIGG